MGYVEGVEDGEDVVDGGGCWGKFGICFFGVGWVDVFVIEWDLEVWVVVEGYCVVVCYGDDVCVGDCEWVYVFYVGFDRVDYIELFYVEIGVWVYFFVVFFDYYGCVVVFL